MPTVDAQARLQGLRELAPLLWPGGAAASGRRAMLVVPGMHRPRILVPASPSKASAAAVLRHGSALSATERAQRRALYWALRSGLGPWLFRGGRDLGTSAQSPFVKRLGDVLDRRVVASVGLTPPRANRKPVLHLLDHEGRTVAFVKVGINPLTCALVRREAAALARMAKADLRTVSVPEVLYAENWDGVEVLVLSPVPSWLGRMPRPDVLEAAMQEVAAAGGPDVGAAPAPNFAQLLRDRADNIATPTDPQDQKTLAVLRELADRLAHEPVAQALRTGTWHGDWTSWNCRQLGDTIALWDWERSDSGVPTGFDALHYRMQDRLGNREAKLVDIATACLDEAPMTLARWNLGDGDTASAAATMTAALYLLAIALRYVADDQRSAGGRGGDVGAWIIPALRTILDERTIGGSGT